MYPELCEDLESFYSRRS